MPQVRVGSLTMHYEAIGKGEPLILISGLGNDSRSWRAQAPQLASMYRVIAFDNRGSGRTDAPDGPYSIAVMAEDTVSLMEALGIRRAHIMGVSMGGYIAQEVAINYPERVAGLVLATTSPGPYLIKTSILLPWVKEALGHLPPLTIFQLMLPFMFNDACFESPEVLEMAVAMIARGSPGPPQVLARQMIACVEYNARHRMGRISAPTLVIAGSDDPFVPLSLSEELAQGIPGARLCLIDGCHGFDSASGLEMARAALAFLETVPRPGY